MLLTAFIGVEAGAPEAVINATELTVMRTGAAKYLAPRSHRGQATDRRPGRL